MTHVLNECKKLMQAFFFGTVSAFNHNYIYKRLCYILQVSFPHEMVHDGHGAFEKGTFLLINVCF